MIDRKVLDGLKLVQDENFAPDAILEADLEYCISQGSQGWGVNRDAAVILRLANEWRATWDEAEKANVEHGKLKGLQMESGRLKKKIAKLEGKLEKANAEILARDLTITELTVAAGSDIPSSEGVDETE